MTGKVRLRFFCVFSLPRKSVINLACSQYRTRIVKFNSASGSAWPQLVFKIICQGFVLKIKVTKFFKRLKTFCLKKNSKIIRGFNNGRKFVIQKGYELRF